MTKHEAITGLVETVEAQRLVVAPENPRSGESVDGDQIAILAQNILSLGLLTPLLGYEADDGSFAVTAGGRRTRAIQSLIAGGEWTGREAVAVRGLPRDEAINAGNAEQLSHVDLSEVDKIKLILSDAYRKMDARIVAKLIGKSEAFVIQRREIGHLPDEIKDALWHGDIAPAEAFGLTYFLGDPDGMAEAFEACCQDGEPYTISDLREMFRRRCQAWSKSKPAQLVGEDAYLAAGGSLQQDLFANDKFILDPGILAKLAREKAAAKVEQDFPEAAFVLEVENAHASDIAYFRGVDSLTDAEREEWEDEYRFQKWRKGDDATPEWLARHDELEAKAERVIPPEAVPLLGVVWEYRPNMDGCAFVRSGVLPEDLEPFYEKGWIDRPVEAPETDEDAPEAAPPAPGDGLSSALREKIKLIRTHALRQKLIRTPNEVIEAYLCHVAREAARPSFSPAFTHRPETAHSPEPDEDGFTFVAAWAEAEQLMALDEAGIKALKPADQRKLMAARMLACLTTHASTGDLDAKEIRQVWTPSIAFLGRYSKSALVEMLVSAGHPAQGLDTQKKGGLLSLLFDHASKDATWLPVGF